ncbi:uncharacterized protein LOC129589940 [Paramacrobiotus metropolitanus]|uniref:uncharacterized protein LOC129589940 n=1 Tax=Paramacrobiotus metropolitanus TaxID=2943436 RepID=UPI00244643AB|nr:uncharacterized protein LOC129589940 [Paramacrobiotus metropolitanus]
MLTKYGMGQSKQRIGFNISLIYGYTCTVLDIVDVEMCVNRGALRDFVLKFMCKVAATWQTQPQAKAKHALPQTPLSPKSKEQKTLSAPSDLNMIIERAIQKAEPVTVKSNVKVYMGKAKSGDQVAFLAFKLEAFEADLKSKGMDTRFLAGCVPALRLISNAEVSHDVRLDGRILKASIVPLSYVSKRVTELLGQMGISGTATTGPDQSDPTNEKPPASATNQQSNLVVSNSTSANPGGMTELSIGTNIAPPISVSADNTGVTEQCSAGGRVPPGERIASPETTKDSSICRLSKEPKSLEDESSDEEIAEPEGKAKKRKLANKGSAPETRASKYKVQIVSNDDAAKCAKCGLALEMKDPGIACTACKLVFHLKCGNVRGRLTDAKERAFKCQSCK